MAIVVPCYDQAHFLADALESVACQTVPPEEVIVVDDGSHDDPGAVAARFPGVRVLRQANGGLASARNAGLTATQARHVVFLDADDALAPDALAAGLECMAAHQGAAFVYGAHQRTDAALQPVGEPLYRRVHAHPHRDILRANPVAMHAAVLYDRRILADSGGFDTALPRCEDYDVYLRLSRQHPVASHSQVVALYRIHDAAMTSDHAEIVRWALLVHDRHRPPEADRAALKAWRKGGREWKRAYAIGAWSARPRLSPGEKWRQRRRMTRIAPLESAVAAVWRAARSVLPGSAVGALKRVAGRGSPDLGTVDLGDLARTRPVSANFGFDRGTPVDRHYIEAFLDRHRSEITGRVLEVGDDTYSRQFGSGVTRQDVLHVSADNPQATIVGDLADPALLPEAAFDCLVLTQTLHLIRDMPAAVAAMHRALRPGGVALLTVPGVSSVDRGEWSSSWLWSLTAPAAEQLFADVFGADNVTVEAHGNVYAATCFLHGLAAEEVNREWLDERDPAYPVIVTVRARRGG